MSIPPNGDSVESAEKKKTGRPTLLTATLADAIIAHMTEGCPLDIAAGLEGIHQRRVFEWLAKGLEEGAGEPYATFAQRVTRARAVLAKGVLSEIREAVYVTKDGREIADMRARQWYAERVLGYAPTQRVVADVQTTSDAEDTPEAIEASVTWLKLHKGGQ